MSFLVYNQVVVYFGSNPTYKIIGGTSSDPEYAACDFFSSVVVFLPFSFLPIYFFCSHRWIGIPT